MEKHCCDSILGYQLTVEMGLVTFPSELSTNLGIQK